MKKILLSLIATLCALSSHAQTIEVFRNGKSIATYTNTPNEHYKVKFYSTGDYDQINGHDYVIIGGLRKHHSLWRLLCLGRGRHLL